MKKAAKASPPVKPSRRQAGVPTTPAPADEDPAALDEAISRDLKLQLGVEASAADEGHLKIKAPISTREMADNGIVMMMELVRQAILKCRTKPQKIDFRNAAGTMYRLRLQTCDGVRGQRVKFKQIACAPCYVLDEATDQTQDSTRWSLFAAMQFPTGPEGMEGMEEMVTAYRKALKAVEDRQRNQRKLLAQAASSAQTRSESAATPAYQVAAAAGGAAWHSQPDSAAASAATVGPAPAPTASADAAPPELCSEHEVSSREIFDFSQDSDDEEPLPSAHASYGPKIISKVEVPSKIMECLETLQVYDKDVILQVRASKGSTYFDVPASDLRTLQLTKWLSDLVINLFAEMLQVRNDQLKGSGHPNCVFFNSFFLTKLLEGCSRIGNWTKHKASLWLLSTDIIFIPYHTTGHWSLVVIDLRGERLIYCNSLPGADKKVLDQVASWLKKEFLRKAGKNVEVEDWTRVFPKTLPKQTNGYDCGVFTLMYMHAMSSLEPDGLCWDQTSIDDLREYIAFTMFSAELELPGSEGRGEKFLQEVRQAAVKRGAKTRWEWEWAEACLAGAGGSEAGSGDAAAMAKAGPVAGVRSEVGGKPQATAAQPSSQQGSGQQAQRQAAGGDGADASLVPALAEGGSAGAGVRLEVGGKPQASAVQPASQQGSGQQAQSQPPAGADADAPPAAALAEGCGMGAGVRSEAGGNPQANAAEPASQQGSGQQAQSQPAGGDDADTLLAPAQAKGVGAGAGVQSEVAGKPQASAAEPASQQASGQQAQSQPAGGNDAAASLALALAEGGGAGAGVQSEVGGKPQASAAKPMAMGRGAGRGQGHKPKSAQANAKAGASPSKRKPARPGQTKGGAGRRQGSALKSRAVGGDDSDDSDFAASSTETETDGDDDADAPSPNPNDKKRPKLTSAQRQQGVKQAAHAGTKRSRASAESGACPAAEIDIPVVNSADCNAAEQIDALINGAWGCCLVRVQGLLELLEGPEVQEIASQLATYLCKHGDAVFLYTMLLPGSVAGGRDVLTVTSNARRITNAEYFQPLAQLQQEKGDAADDEDSGILTPTSATGQAAREGFNVRAQAAAAAAAAWAVAEAAAAAATAEGIDASESADLVEQGLAAAAIAVAAAVGAGSEVAAAGGADAAGAVAEGNGYQPPSPMATPGRDGYVCGHAKPSPGLVAGYHSVVEQVSASIEAAVPGYAAKDPSAMAYAPDGSCDPSINQATHLDTPGGHAAPVIGMVGLQGAFPIKVLPGSHLLIKQLVTMAKVYNDQARADREVSQLAVATGFCREGKRQVVPPGHVLLMHGNLLHHSDAAHPAWGPATRLHLSLHEAGRSYPTYADRTFTPDHIDSDVLAPSFGRLYGLAPGLRARMEKLDEVFAKAEEAVGGGAGMGGEGHYGSLTLPDMARIFTSMYDFECRSVLADVGSGLGRPQLLAAVQYCVQYSIGIELDGAKCLKAASFMRRVAAEMDLHDVFDVADMKLIHKSAADLTTLQPATHVLLIWAGWDPANKKAVANLIKVSSSVGWVVMVEHRYVKVKASDDAEVDLRWFPEMALHEQFPVQMEEQKDKLVARIFRVVGRDAAQTWPPAGGLLELPSFEASQLEYGRGCREKGAGGGRGKHKK